MSLTPQMLRPRAQSETPTSAAGNKLKKGTWSKCFPAKFSTETTSCTFVKKLVTVAVSNITYLRTMFPEKAYANRSLDGLSLKILKSKNECPEALKVANWMLGAFDALEKKYLRELILVVYKDKANPDIVEEMYTFKFSYPEGHTSCQILKGKEEVKKKISDNDVYKSTQNLLRTLVILTQSMNPISDDSSLTMKLTYYDEVTPEDYEPAGFLPTPLVQPQLPAGSAVLQSGQVSTLYHSVNLGVQAVVGPGNEHEDLPPCREEVANQEQGSRQSQTPLQSTSFTPSSSIRSRSASVQPSQAPRTTTSHLGIPTPQSQGNLVPSSVSLLSEHSEDTSKIQCVCSNTHPDPIMLDCSHCSFQQHASCYRILSVKDIPTEHCCVTCSKQYGINCTDNKLVKMSSNPAVAGTCLFRRALLLLLEVEIITVDVVLRRLGIDNDTAGAIIDKLGGEGCLEDDEVEGQWKVLKEVLESTAIPKFIGRKKGKKSNKGEGVVIKGDSQEGGVCGSGDRKVGNKDKEIKVAKCSVVADAYKVRETGEKRRLIELEERASKRKKVSEVKGKLQI